MTNREALLEKIAAARFAQIELQLYLDTHPSDSRALRSFKQYQATADKLTAEFEENYGPLTPSDTYGDTSWEWVNSPWPWENQEASQ